VKAAVDSKILFDLLAGDPAVAGAAGRVLATAAGAGPVVVCPVVYAELAAAFGDRQTLDRFLGDTGLQLEAFSIEALWHAGQAWRAYGRRRGQQVQCPPCGHRFNLDCPRCQAPVVWRQHLITDFLIGGHAVAQADLLITRDPGYYHTYFQQLQVVAPSAVPPSG
jgi:predicted nucleic acid-binding protein